MASERLFVIVSLAAFLQVTLGLINASLCCYHILIVWLNVQRSVVEL